MCVVDVTCLCRFGFGGVTNAAVRRSLLERLESR